MARFFRTRILIPLVITVVCLGVLVSHAKVFFRWGSTSESTRTLESLGGRLAYRTEVEINGAAGRLHVFGFEQDLGSLVRELRQAFDADDLQDAGGTLAQATIQSGSHRLRLIVTRLEGQTVVFKIEQSDDGTSSGPAASPDFVKGIPAYPQGEVSFSAKDKNAGLSMSVSTALDSPGAVRSFYAEHLPSSGWSAPLGNMGRGNTGMALYEKGTELCCVHVSASPSSGSTRITLLHKRRGMK